MPIVRRPTDLPVAASYDRAWARTQSLWWRNWCCSTALLTTAPPGRPSVQTFDWYCICVCLFIMYVNLCVHVHAYECRRWLLTRGLLTGHRVTGLLSVHGVHGHCVLCVWSQVLQFHFVHSLSHFHLHKQSSETLDKVTDRYAERLARSKIYTGG